MNPIFFHNARCMNMNYFITFLSGFMALFSVTSVWAASSMIWSQDDGSAINVYYSPSGNQAMPITTTGVHVSPNLFRAKDSTWITWVDKTDMEAARLRFAQISKRGAILETGSVPTQSTRIYAPAISADPSEQRVWIIWAESNGRRENLYASFRNIRSKHGIGWQQPLQITPDSEYSANIPIIDTTLVDRVSVSWVRTSKVSTETATLEVLANDWQAALRNDSGPALREIPSRMPVTRKISNYDSFTKILKRGQSRSADERKWEVLTDNRRALMGAIHSGSGPSKRLVIEVK